MTWEWYRMSLRGKAASESITQSFLQAKADGKQTVGASWSWSQDLLPWPARAECASRLGPGTCPTGSCIFSYCQVRPTALKNHPIISCDKSSSYLEDQAVNTQGRQMATSWWLLHVREQRTEQTLLSPLMGVHQLGSPARKSITSTQKQPENEDASCKC